MQGCSNNEQLIGRAKTLELAYGCADLVPEEGDWKLMGPSNFGYVGFKS